MVVLVAAPIVVGVMAHFGHAHRIKVVAQVSYLWMGFAFLFFLAALTFDAYGLLMQSAGRHFAFDAAPWIAPSSIGALFLAAFATGYGWWAAQQVRVEHVAITSPKLDARSPPLRVVQISDVHLGLLTDERWLQRVVQTVTALQPDVVVSTGDLLDMQPNDLEHLLHAFDALHPRLGKYAVTGNHEAFAGIAASRAVTRRAGFRLLSFEAVPLTRDITLAGVDDPAVAPDHHGKEAALLQTIAPEQFVILLKHQPRVIADARERVDVQLSGHIHGGQIVPFNLFTWMSYRVSTGLTPFGDRLRLYVSRGTGVWGPPIRFLADPEITLIELHRAP
jgi:predicted MPP superfamily phosphohydrolase